MTSLIRFSPTRELRQMQREVDRLFDNFLSNGSNGETESAVWTPRVDLAETEDAYLIHLDVPGLKREDLDISVHNGTLTVSGERKHEVKEEKANFVRMERAYGRFYRSFTLPARVVADAIEATYADGVLDIRVPKAEESKPRRIDVR